MGVLDGPNNKILKPDTRVQDALHALADHVDHGKFIYNKNVQTVKVDGLVFGYRLEDHRVFMRRIVYVKVPGWRIEDIGEDERARILTAMFNVFLMPGNNPPEMKKIAPDCLLFTHDFVPEIAVERKPGLVTLAGGWEKPKGDN